MRLERGFTLDCIACSSISTDYSKTNPKVAPIIMPYNSQRDRHCNEYFRFHGVNRTLNKTGQDKGGTSIDGPVIDQFQARGPGFQYLSLRNQFGAGHSPEITYKRRHCYATRSNKIRKLRLPGGKLGIQYVKKKTKGPQTPSGDHGKIHGVPHLRTQKYSRKHLAKNKKTVNRAYGGVLSGGAVRERIVRAFLVEEQKIVKKVLKLQANK